MSGWTSEFKIINRNEIASSFYEMQMFVIILIDDYFVVLEDVFESWYQKLVYWELNVLHSFNDIGKNSATSKKYKIFSELQKIWE